MRIGLPGREGFFIRIGYNIGTTFIFFKILPQKLQKLFLVNRFHWRKSVGATCQIGFSALFQIQSYDNSVLRNSNRFLSIVVNPSITIVFLS